MNSVDMKFEAREILSIPGIPLRLDTVLSEYLRLNIYELPPPYYRIRDIKLFEFFPLELQINVFINIFKFISLIFSTYPNSNRLYRDRSTVLVNLIFLLIKIRVGVATFSAREYIRNIWAVAKTL